MMASTYHRGIFVCIAPELFRGCASIVEDIPERRSLRFAGRADILEVDTEEMFLREFGGRGTKQRGKAPHFFVDENVHVFARPGIHFSTCREG